MGLKSKNSPAKPSVPDGLEAHIPAKNCHMTKEMSVLAGASTLPIPGNLEAKETSATSSAEQYFVHASIALETRQVQSMKACMRHMFDSYLKKALRTVNNPVKMKHKKQCLLRKEPVKTEDVDKKDDQCQAMEKPAKEKTVTWMLRGATKAISTRKTKTMKAVPRVTPTRSK
jgi:hypothetical protein